MLDLAKYLYPIPRSLTGNGINLSFEVFKNIHPEFQTLSFATGKEVFDWVIPPVWNVKTAYIEHESGQKFCEFSVNNLHLVGYSQSVDKVMDQNISENGLTRNDTDKNIRKKFGTLDDFLLTAMSSQLDSLSFVKEGSTKRKNKLAKFLDLDIFDFHVPFATETETKRKSGLGM